MSKLEQIIYNMPTHKAKLVRQFMDNIPCLNPSEMFQVPIQRETPIVYMPYNDLIDLIWQLVDQLEKAP